MQNVPFQNDVYYFTKLLMIECVDPLNVAAGLCGIYFNYFTGYNFPPWIN